ncbi:MAG: hypothetical protein AAF715_16060 [Myxococcota bacterium]
MNTDVREAVVGLLTLGPSSFGATLRFVSAECERTVTVEELAQTVAALASRNALHLFLQTEGGFARITPAQLANQVGDYKCWMGELSRPLRVDDVSYDPVGVWLHLAEDVSMGFEPAWVVDDDAIGSTLSISARTREDANEAIATYAEMRPQMTIVAQRWKVLPPDGAKNDRRSTPTREGRRVFVEVTYEESDRGA